MHDKPDGHATTELRMIITEDKDGRMVVEYDARIKGTETIIQMRPSHVLGQLRGASAILERQFYTLPEEREESKSTHGRAKDKKRP